MKYKLIVLLIVVSISSALYASLWFLSDQSIHLDHSKSVIIERGMSERQVARLLEKEGIISQEYLFFLYKKLFFYKSNIRAGEYEFSASQSIKNVAQKLVTGDVLYRKITIPEGLTNFQIIKIIESHEGLNGEIEDMIEEGSMFPDTYYYTYGESKKHLIQTMQNRMNKIVRALSNQINTRDLINDEKKLIILASIIEKEAKLDEEKPIIASVFLNRLRIGMMLQSDPTALYAVTQGGALELNRRPNKEDMKIDSPYNTYITKGLPPGPIGSPGAKSLEAAISPAKTRYLYFYLCGHQGAHKFASTYKEHLQNIKSRICKR